MAVRRRSLASASSRQHEAITERLARFRQRGPEKWAGKARQRGPEKPGLSGWLCRGKNLQRWSKKSSRFMGNA